MKKFTLLMLCLLAGIMATKAQIGYQISLLNTATGQPRANETVTVSVTLSNNAGESFYSETKSATTNDFGVLSLSIGNADTFKNVDLSQMPFFIEVTANGVMIGKSQILSVPVAEVAKRVAPIDKNLIVGTWKWQDYSFMFNDNYTGAFIMTNPNFPVDPKVIPFTYEMEGSTIYIYSSDDNSVYATLARYNNNHIFIDGGKYSR